MTRALAAGDVLTVREEARQPEVRRRGMDGVTRKRSVAPAPPWPVVHWIAPSPVATRVAPRRRLPGSAPPLHRRPPEYWPELDPRRRTIGTPLLPVPPLSDRSAPMHRDSPPLSTRCLPGSFGPADCRDSTPAPSNHCVIASYPVYRCDTARTPDCSERHTCPAKLPAISRTR